MRFSLLSWNVLDDAYIRDEWYPRCDPAHLRGPERRRRLLRQLTERRADVMALQECSAGLRDALVLHFPSHSVTWTPCSRSGLALLVRGGAPTVEALSIPGSNWRAQWARLPNGVTLANVHLTWTARETPIALRTGHTQLRTVLDRTPDLVVGDFNARPTAPERRLAHERGWEELGPVGPTFAMDGTVQPIDAVLGRGGWTGSADPLTRLPQPTILPSETHPSDHLPLRVVLERPGQAS